MSPPKRRVSDSQPETAIEVELRMQLEKEIEAREKLERRVLIVERKQRHFDRLSIRIGFLGMACLGFGVAITMGAEKAKEKVLSLMMAILK